MDQKQQFVVILGGGESGTGAALLAAQKGFAVFLSDKGRLGDVYRQTLVDHGISFEEETHSEEKILGANLVIKSPGIPDDAPLVAALRGKSIPVIDELSFALRYTKAKVVGITGTNGKTTTTLLTHHLFKEAGVKVGLAGNVGHSLAALLAKGETFDGLVLVVSSFQLDGMPGFKPNTAILLNITPDHLNRYEHSFEKYIASKMQICQHLGPEDAFIYNAEDATVRAGLLSLQIACMQLPVAQEGKSQAAAQLKAEGIRIEALGHDFFISYDEMVLKGKHNYLNTACAVLAALRAGIGEASIRASLQNFVNAPHRLEPVASIAGVEWINDSKATNVDSAWFALDAMDKPVIWIAGGTDKGNDYGQLNELVNRKVKALVCMGVDNSKLLAAFGLVVPAIYDTHSMEEAVNTAARLAEDGDVVLLSPACASFDLFRNYGDRGEQFRSKVLELKNSR